MKSGSLKSDISYLRNLIEAGVDGVTSAWKGTGDRGFKTDGVWAPAAVGAGIGVMSVCLKRNRPRFKRKVAVCGLVGSALGFGVGVAWASRAFTGTAARSALQKVNGVRDAHWLERNPIAYG
jgi:hypothetical protein